MIFLNADETDLTDARGFFKTHRHNRLSVQFVMLKASLEQMKCFQNADETDLTDVRGFLLTEKTKGKRCETSCYTL